MVTVEVIVVTIVRYITGQVKDDSWIANSFVTAGVHIFTVKICST